MGLEFLVQAVQIAMALPVVGKIIVAIVAAAPAAAALATALVTLWHAAIAVLTGFSKFPGMGKLADIAGKLEASSAKVDDFEQNKVLPIINRLSAMPLPQKPAAPAPALPANGVTPKA